MRKLASIQQIEDVQPIPEADKICKVKIKGWWCVTRVGEFKVGDYGVYHEIDSLLPVIDRYSFLEKGSTLKTTIVDGVEKKGYRLKTIRLKGQISQGLILPLSSFPEITNSHWGADLSELLNIYKYEAPIPVHLAGEVKGGYPGYIPKTDEDRVQNCPELLEQYKGRRFYLTTKIDGTSSTYFKYDKEFGVCGKNLEFKENNKVIFWNIANRYNLKEKLPDGYAIQAETAGEGIQCNRHLLKGVDSYVFYVFDINNYKYLGVDDMLAFVKELGMKTVPVIDDNFILNHTCEELLKIADAPCPFNKNVLQEGIVFRLYDSTEKITFKVISNEYILKYGL